MDARAHVTLRMAALALLVAVAAWPRSSRPPEARSERTHQLVRASAPHALLVEPTMTASVRSVDAPPAEVATEDGDESRLTN